MTKKIDRRLDQVTRDIPPTARVREILRAVRADSPATVKSLIEGMPRKEYLGNDVGEMAAVHASERASLYFDRLAFRAMSHAFAVSTDDPSPMMQGDITAGEIRDSAIQGVFDLDEASRRVADAVGLERDEAFAYSVAFGDRVYRHVLQHCEATTDEDAIQSLVAGFLDIWNLEPRSVFNAAA